jgi:PST family polysaccharide transporter
VRHALLFVGGVGLAMGLVASIGAPLLVHLLLGPGYETAIPVLRLFGLLPLLVAVTTVLGIYWAIPFGHDRAVLVAILTAGLANVVLAFALVPRWGALGMAASAILAEVVVLGFFGTLYLRHRARA